MKRKLLPKLLINLYKMNLTYIKNKLKKPTTEKYCFPLQEVYFNKEKNKYYFKLATISGFICRDIFVDEVLKNNEILSKLDKKSFAYANYVSGVLDTLSNNEQNSIYQFTSICTNDPKILIVKSLIDLSIQRWDIFEAYEKELYYNLDKASIVKFIEIYLIAKLSLNIPKNNITNQHLRIIK